MYEVVIHAGQDNQEVIGKYSTFDKACAAVADQFDLDDLEEFGVDIMKNGSTES